jgi:hypothetical protein
VAGLNLVMFVVLILFQKIQNTKRGDESLCHIRINELPFACMTMVICILRNSVVVVIIMNDVVVCHLVRLSVHSTRTTTILEWR